MTRSAVVEVVRDAAGQPADRVHLPRLRERLLELLPRYTSSSVPENLRRRAVLATVAAPPGRGNACNVPSAHSQRYSIASAPAWRRCANAADTRSRSSDDAARATGRVGSETLRWKAGQRLDVVADEWEGARTASAGLGGKAAIGSDCDGWPPAAPRAMRSACSTRQALVFGLQRRFSSSRLPLVRRLALRTPRSCGTGRRTRRPSTQTIGSIGLKT